MIEKKKNNEIKVSVIMPVYNSGEYLKTAVESILNQSLREIELILVDDGSTDGSADRCDEYARQDSRVVVIHQKNGGICAARNSALKIARGEYIGFSDHDDVFVKSSLLPVYQFVKSAQSDFIKCGYKSQLINGGKIVKENVYTYKDIVYNSTDMENHVWEILNSGMMVNVWDGLFSLDFIKRNNITFNDIYRYGGGEDIDFNFQCLLCAKKAQFSSTIMYLHYIRDSFSTSAGYRDCYLAIVPNHMSSLLHYIVQHKINLYNNHSEYTYYWVRNNLISICRLLSNKECPLKASQKRAYLEGLRGKDFFFEWMLNQSVSLFSKKSKLVAIIYWLYCHKLYLLSVNLFKCRKFYHKLCFIQKK